LRTWLKEKLPAYMVPAAFMLLDAFPLNSNGKIDRRVLPMPDYNHREQQDDFVAPRTPLEKEVANSWSQVLGIQLVGLHDNFFALGGHSLLAMQVTTRLQSTLHVDVPIRSFFEAPTLAQLTEAITHLQVQDAGTRLTGLRPRSRKAYRVPASSSLSTQENTASRSE
jgi:acyl carrier protein